MSFGVSFEMGSLPKNEMEAEELCVCSSSDEREVYWSGSGEMTEEGWSEVCSQCHNTDMGVSELCYKAGVMPE